MADMFNPGEPVFDQRTGDIVIDPTTGDAVLVEPGALWTDPVTGAIHQRDDVANAAYWRVNTYVGEVLRDQSKGVDYHGIVFGGAAVSSLIIDEIKGTVVQTPGIAALADARLRSVDQVNRSALFFFRATKRNGSVVPAALQIGQP